MRAVVQAAAACLVLSACAPPPLEEVRRSSGDLGSAATQHLERTVERFDTDGTSFRVDRSRLWLGREVLRRRTDDSLPDSLGPGSSYQMSIPIGPPGEQTKLLLLDTVSQQIGLPIHVHPQTTRLATRLAAASGEGEDGEPGAPATTAGLLSSSVAGSSPVPPPPGAGAPAEAVALIPGLLYPDLAEQSPHDLVRGGYRQGRLREDFVFEGTGTELLSKTARALGFQDWTYDQGTVWLVYHALREFPLYVLSAAQGKTSDARVGDVIEALQRMCGGCDVEPRASLGLVQVTALPALMPAVEDWIGRVNRRTTEQFGVEIALYNIARERVSDQQLDLNLNLSPGGAAVVGGGDAGDAGDTATPDSSGHLLSFPAGQGGQHSGQISVVPQGNWFADGSNVLLKSLATAGLNTRVYSATFVTMNGRRQEVNDSTTTKREIGQRTVGGQETGTGTETQFEDLTSGFKIGVTAQSFGHGRVLLSYDFEIQDDRTEGSGGAASQLTRSLENSLLVPLGSTIVFSAYADIQSNSKREGTLTPSFWGIGGAQNETFKVTHWLVSIRATRFDASARPDGSLPPLPPRYRRPTEAPSGVVPQ